MHQSNFYMGGFIENAETPELAALAKREGIPFCEDAMDANDDGQVDTADVIFTLDYIFQGGLAPALPFPDCGADLTDDLLGCESYSPCD